MGYTVNHWCRATTVGAKHLLNVERYFIHVCDRTGFAEDEDGQDFADRQAALLAALQGVRSMVSEDARHGTIDLNGRVRIADERGETVAELAYRDAFDLRLDDSAS